MSDAINLTEEQRTLVERLGVMHEKGGLQPAASRVLGLLLVAPETELSFDQIRETLNLSKSAASNAINFLLTTGKVDYVTRPGERKRYFKSKVAFWKENIREKFRGFGEAADLMEEALHTRPSTTPEFNRSLEEVIDFIRFLNDELPGLYAKWEQKRE
ncbi:GbsR/MarR family transcriptional regulator [Roseivirga sp. BDSF3-8]|uniref:GbsR/MarR family transcriptional regulator n=1 Tax=Roseivirga sp. BDSF3-8 TaxID=3241598 RepID=UPI0035321195